MNYERRSSDIAGYGLGFVAMSFLSVKRSSKRVGWEVVLSLV